MKKVVTERSIGGVMALDLSMEKSLDAFHELLDGDIPIFYRYYHRVGEVPQSD